MNQAVLTDFLSQSCLLFHHSQFLEWIFLMCNIEPSTIRDLYNFLVYFPLQFQNEFTVNKLNFSSC